MFANSIPERILKEIIEGIPAATPRAISERFSVKISGCFRSKIVSRKKGNNCFIYFEEFQDRFQKKLSKEKMRNMLGRIQG